MSRGNVDLPSTRRSIGLWCAILVAVLAWAASDAIAEGRARMVRALPDEEIRQLRGNPNVRLVIQPRLTVRLLSVCAAAATGDAAVALADVRVRRATTADWLRVAGCRWIR